MASVLGTFPVRSGHRTPPSVSCYAGQLGRSNDDYRNHKRVMAQAIRQASTDGITAGVDLVDTLIQLREVASRRMREEGVSQVIQDVVLAEVTVLCISCFNQENIASGGTAV